MQIQENISLKDFNTFGLNAVAKYFVRVSNQNEVYEVIKSTNFKNTKYFVLGGGSNILLIDNINALVIKNEIKGIEKVKETNEHIYLKVGGGENWHDFVQYCVDKNYAGVENLALIPGTVGASPVQNIGAYGVELKDVFEKLEAINLKECNRAIYTKNACKFEYRNSIFKAEHKNEFLITHVTFKLNKNPVFNLSYGTIIDVINTRFDGIISLKTIFEAVILIRQSKLPDPKVLGNAGSFFKNPEISPTYFENLIEKHPNMPHFKTSDAKVKIPAGWLIEQCGWKGKVVGNTGAHKDQSLVLVNYGNATGNEIYQLAIEIKKSVYDRFGITIEMEVNVLK
jgi:UDP-N-acetylmuramate dehydrogenase